MSKLKVLLMILVAVFDLAVFAAVVKGADVHSTIPEKLRAEFRSGLGGNAEALNAATGDAEAILAKDPKNAEVLAWHGAALSFRAGQMFRAGDPENAGPLLQQGFSELNDAVRFDPEDPEVTAVRGAVFLKASAAMPYSDSQQDLLHQGLADYVKTYEKSKAHWSELPADVKGRMLTGIADGYARTGQEEQATEFYKHAQSELKGTPFAAEATQWLQSHTK